MKVIGLTGGIGAGKSTVSLYLREKGYQVLDADQVARELAEPGSEALIQIVTEFGEDVLFPDGTLDRKKLGRMVFGDENKTRKLDAIMRDKILELLYLGILKFKEDGELIRESGEGKHRPQDHVIFIDAPLLYESGLDKLTQEVWVVDAEDEIRIYRVMERDHLSRKEIEDRMGRQIARAEKLRRAHRVFDNSGYVCTLYRQLDQALEEVADSVRSEMGDEKIKS